MLLSTDQVFSQPSEGRIDLQVPTIYIGQQPPLVHWPDDWFHWIIPHKKGYAPVAGNEKGYLYINSRGYAALKDAIKKAYLQAAQFGGYRGKLTWDEAAQDWDRPYVEGEKYFADDELGDVWDEFDQEIQKHFALLKRYHAQALMKTQHKLAEAKQFGTPKSIKYWTRKLNELQAFVV